MDATRLPPSLKVTPGRIAEYLAARNVPCGRCGYPLRGLPEPRCPECGAWTDLSRRVYVDALSRMSHRRGSWGLLEGYLVQRSRDRCVHAIHGCEIRDIGVEGRWPGHTRLWMTIIGAAALIAIPGVFILLAMSPGWATGLCLAGYAAVGYILLHLTVVIEPQWWLLVHTSTGTRRIPVQNVGASDAKKQAAEWQKAIEAHRRSESPPPDEADAHAEPDAAENGRCPMCGYDVHGPRLTVRAPNRATQALGVMLVIIGGVFIPCCAFRPMVDWSYGTSTGALVPCVSLLALATGALGLGIWLIRLKREAPAIPDWPGPGNCSACGWRAPAESGASD